MPDTFLHLQADADVQLIKKMVPYYNSFLKKVPILRLIVALLSKRN